MFTKQEQGSCDIVIRDNKIAFIRSFDKKPISIASSAHGKDPLDAFTRWLKKDKVYVEITRPAINHVYNEKMGGIDLCDRMVTLYRIGARTKKWTIQLMMHLIDLSLVNVWLLYKQDKIAQRAAVKDIMQFMDFRMDVDLCYLSAMEAENSSDESDVAPPPTKCPIIATTPSIH